MKFLYGFNIGICLVSIVFTLVDSNFAAFCGYFSALCGWQILYMKETNYEKQ